MIGLSLLGRGCRGGLVTVPLKASLMSLPFGVLEFERCKAFAVSLRVQRWQHLGFCNAPTFATPARLEKLEALDWLRLVEFDGVALRPLPKISSASFSLRLRVRSCCMLDLGPTGKSFSTHTSLNDVVERRSHFTSSHFGGYGYGMPTSSSE